MVSKRKIEGIMITTKDEESCSGYEHVDLYIKTDTRHVNWLMENISTNPHYSEGGCTIEGRKVLVNLYIFNEKKWNKIKRGL